MSATTPLSIGINEAKLRPPRACSRIVGHERLLLLQPDAEEASVVRVMAPAGYGKTTLMSEWAAHAAVPVLWVSLDHHDDDPTTLVTHIAQAAMTAGSPDPELIEAIRTPAASVWTSLIPRLSALLRSLGPFRLMFDDTQSVTAPAAVDVIEWLALHVPPGAQVIIAGRSASGRQLTRLAAYGVLADRGPADLALTDSEAHALLLERGFSVTTDESARLNQACEGWVTGVLMTAGATGGARENRVGSTATDVARLVDEYVESEVMAQLSPADAEFVLQVAVLKTVSGPLADAALERSGSAELLGRLCAGSVFVTRLGSGWCRLHDLLRSALQARLERERPALAAQIRSRAAAWHAEHGRSEYAVHYSMESGSVDETAALMGRFALAEFSRGRQVTLDGWMDWAESEGFIPGDAQLTLAAAMTAALTGKPERAERWATSRVQDASPHSRSSSKSADEGYRALLDAWQCRRGAEAMLADATRAAELIPPESGWQGSALGAIGLAQTMCGLRTESISTFEILCAPVGPARVDINARSVSAVLLARLALEDHDVRVARERVTFSASVRTEAGITMQALQALEDAVAARLALLVGPDVEEARRLLAHAQSLRPLSTWAIPSLALVIRLELIKVNLMLADMAAIRVLIREASDILRHRPGLGDFETELRELREQVEEQAETVSGPSSLTTAELRLIPWLATHLSFREIGERLYLSTNTVKTEALSAYRKLGVSSRSDAVEAAVRFGLLEEASLPGILSDTSTLETDLE